jgi:polysaccharide biosynthesis transport protein
MRIEAPVEAAHSQDLIDIPELVRTVSRYKWGIVGLTLLTAAIAALIAFNIRPVYRGTTSILIELKPQRVVQVHEVFDPGIGLSEYYGTQYMVLRSREMAERVVDRLQLLDHPEFAAEKPANTGRLASICASTCRYRRSNRKGWTRMTRADGVMRWSTP